ncbi:hypothetical protein [Croceimicrobium hydrocarbonivorans]|uniref:Uncharacterized protein n=1 Tax=Croceimicrobium hydrocarbonivorans TaxID=2761580 RepID=A0A7H0VHE2_9FLAO|nr:hypothetical protein [Croceimicrobium hydrocarbonivorans]QNR25140.1 hypothetical protein H4K34_04695 [Croceimicrobium hydrocarbonivorans]
MNKKLRTYLISGLVLLYLGLSDDNFMLSYHGIAVAAGLTSFAFAYIEWKKESDKNKA